MDKLRFQILVDDEVVAIFRTYDETVRYMGCLEEEGINPNIIGMRIKNREIRKEEVK